MIVGHPHAPAAGGRRPGDGQVAAERHEHAAPSGLERGGGRPVGSQRLGGRAEVEGHAPREPGSSPPRDRAAPSASRGSWPAAEIRAMRPRSDHLVEVAVIAERDQRAPHRRVDVAAGQPRRPQRTAHRVEQDRPDPDRRSGGRVKSSAPESERNREQARSNSSTIRTTAASPNLDAGRIGHAKERDGPERVEANQFRGV